MAFRNLIPIVGFIIVMAIAIGVSGPTHQDTATEVQHEEETKLTLPQLEKEGRPDAATMEVIGAAPMQPKFHQGFWDRELRQDSCLACHANPDSGAPTPPSDHYYDNDVTKAILRDSCIQCHAEQKDTKPAFNREE